MTKTNTLYFLNNLIESFLIFSSRFLATLIVKSGHMC